MQQWRPENPPAMTSDEVSMERAKSFVKALQELKNLRPQLYSAAEYCEKSYLHNEQKQMVLDNLKDYAVRALVNAVDHLGTVAYKLTDLFEQQAVDVSAVELKISCLNQKILTCQTYIDKEGIRQQQMSAATPRLHKHYIIPNSVSKRSPSNLQQQTNAEQNQITAKARPHPSGSPATQTLSWLLASENNTAPTGALKAKAGNGDSKTYKMASESFRLIEEDIAPSPLSIHLHSSRRPPNSNVVPHAFGLRNHMDSSKPISAFRSFDTPERRELYRPPARSKSMLAVFFAKNKTIKQKKAYAS